MKNENLSYRGDRVRDHTADEINHRIDLKSRKDVEVYKTGEAEAIDARIRELEQEWDVERVLEMNASTLALIGLVLGIRGNKRWLALPAVVLPFLLLHATEGWCPPLPILRRLGIRTQREIEAEKFALKSLQKTKPAGASSRS